MSSLSFLKSVVGATEPKQTFTEMVSAIGSKRQIYLIQL